MSSTFFQQSQQLNTKALFDLSHLSEGVQSHLKKVYFNLALILLVSSLGTYTQMAVFHLNQLIVILGTFASLFYILFTTYSQHKSQDMRYLALVVYGYFQGAGLSDLIKHTLRINPNIVLWASASTFAIFASFSLVALLAKRREYLYLGGFLTSAISIMCLLSFINIFVGSSSIPLLHLYGGLFVFIGYVVYDTQLIIEKAQNPETRDDIKHTLELFIDFVAIFVRILIILSRSSEKKKRNK